MWTMCILPSYSRTSVKVGETTWSSDPEPRGCALDEGGLARRQVAGEGDDVAGARAPRRRRARGCACRRPSSSPAGREVSTVLRTARAVPQAARAAPPPGSARIDWKSDRNSSNCALDLAAAVQDRRGMERREDDPAADLEPLAAHAADRHLTVEDQARREVPQGHDHAGPDRTRSGPRDTACRRRSRRAAGRGCPAAGTSRRSRCRRPHRRRPIPSSIVVSN